MSEGQAVAAPERRRALPTVRIRPCEESDIPSVMRFIDEHWRRGHVLSHDETLLRWQFDPRRAATGEFAGLSVVLAVVSGEIRGMLGLIPFDFNVRGRVRRGSWVSQWICTPELRRYNVALSLFWRVHRLKYDALFGLGLSEQGQRLTSALGFHQICDVPRWIGVFDDEGTRDLLLPTSSVGEEARLRQSVAAYVVGGNRSQHTQQPYPVVPWDVSFREPWDRFWRRRLAPSLIGPARDSSYLTWRYCRHPRFRYEILVATDPVSGEPLGLTVLRTETIRGSDRKVMRILDLIGLPPACEALVAAIVAAAKKQEVIFADFYCTSTRAAGALEAAGFRRHARHLERPAFPSRFQPPDPGDSPLGGAFWLAADLNQEIQPLAEQTDFHITKSDSDQDRPN